MFGVMKVKNAIQEYFNNRGGDGDNHHGNVMLTNNDHGRFCDAHLDKGVRDGTAVTCRNFLFARFSWHYLDFS